MSSATTRIPSSGPPSYHSSSPSTPTSTTTRFQSFQHRPKIVGSIPANAPSRPPSCPPPSYEQDSQPPNYYQVALDDQRRVHLPGIPSYFQPQIPPGYHPAPPHLQPQSQIPPGYHPAPPQPQPQIPPGYHPAPPHLQLQPPPTSFHPSSPHLQQQVQNSQHFNTPQSPTRFDPSPSSLQQQLTPFIPPPTTDPFSQPQNEQQPNMSQPTFLITSPYNYPYTLTATAMVNGAHTQSLLIPHPSVAGYQYVAYGQYYYPAPATYYYGPASAYQAPFAWIPQYWYHA